jgi:hypothetical protein
MTEQRLRRLLRDCLVQIEGTDGQPAGSGFFLAPGYVLTCSHVVKRRAQSPITIRWQDAGPRAGTVVYASPPPPRGADSEDNAATIWPEPDLAVIRLDADFPHPCARLGSREPEEGSYMVAAGRRMPFGDDPGTLFSARLEYTGKFLYLMRLANERFGPGMSGGPVLDLTRGEVCGVAKLAGPQQDGYAVPVRLLYDLPREVAGDVLRSHDRYHDANRAWVGAQRTLWDATPSVTAALLPPDREAELLALLAQLPESEPESLGRLYRECADRLVHRDPGPLREPRDVALGLAELTYEQGRPHPVIIFAESLAARYPALTTGLRDWSTVEAERRNTWNLLRDWRDNPERAGRGGRQAGTETNPMSVIVQLKPSDHDPDRYVYTVWRNREDVVLVERENEPLELAEITARLKEKLPARLGELPGDHVIVEFILPPELFDEPVHMWAVFRNSHILLGYRYPVVIRDWERFYDAEDRNHAKLKWDWLSTQDTTPMHWLQCVDGRTASYLYAWFEAKIERAAMGLPGPASEYAEAFNAALDSGVRVALWSQTRCGAHDGIGIRTNNSPCDGMLFRRAARKELSQKPVHLLPAKLRDLRLSSGTLSESALLWDNPHRGPHPRGLAVH